MAGYAKNQEIGVQGSPITLDVKFYNFAGGVLTDPDSTPTFKIFDPTNTEVFSGTGVKTAVGCYEATYDIPAGAEISTEWKIEWTALINGATVGDAWEYFIVMPPGAPIFGDEVIIEDKWLSLIKKVLAYPKVPDILLSDTEVKAYCVYPALHEYFTKFPIKEDYIEGVPAEAELTLDFPDEYTFGVVDIRLANKDRAGASGTFWDIYRFQMRGYPEVTRGKYGTKWKYSSRGRDEIELFNLQRDTMLNKATTKFTVRQEERKIYAYTDVPGDINVTWAKWSVNFDHVKFERKMDVVRLAQAYLLQHLADSTQLVSDAGLELEMNSDKIEEKAKDIREEIIEKWKNFPDIIFIRN